VELIANICYLIIDIYNKIKISDINVRYVELQTCTINLRYLELGIKSENGLLYSCACSLSQ